jgi:hypothetical protein
MTSNLASERKKKNDELLQHLKQFIKLKLELIPYDEKANQTLFNEDKSFAAGVFIEQSDLLAQVVWMLNRLDKSGELFKKKMPNGSFRIYSYFHCYGSIDQWRKCPELECVLIGLLRSALTFET